MVLLAMVASIVALPALLTVVGTRIDRLRIFRAPGRRSPSTSASGIASPAGSCAGRCSCSGVVIAVLLLLGSPFLRVNFGQPDDRVLPESSAASRIANDQLRDELRRQCRRDVPRRHRRCRRRSATVDDLAAGISALGGVATSTARRAVRRRRWRHRRRASALHVRRHRAAGRGAGDRDGLGRRRGPGRGRCGTSTPRSTCRSAATPPASSTPSRRSVVTAADRAGASSSWPPPSCCSCCPAACSCRSRPSCSTRSA